MATHDYVCLLVCYNTTIVLLCEYDASNRGQSVFNFCVISPKVTLLEIFRDVLSVWCYISRMWKLGYFFPSYFLFTSH